MLAPEDERGRLSDAADACVRRPDSDAQANCRSAEPDSSSFLAKPSAALTAIKGVPVTSGTLLSRWNLLGLAARDAHLSRSDLAVLHAIADRVGDTGTAWPSVRRIAEDARVDQRTVTRSINRLCESGYLIRQSGNFTSSNVYRLGTGELARTGDSTRTGEHATTGKAARRGESVAGCGRTRHEGMGELAHVILPVNPPNESTHDSSTPAALTANANAIRAEQKPAVADKAAVRVARLAQVTREAIETFNDSKLTKANGGLVPNVDPDVGADKRRAQVAKSLKVARDICRKEYESEVITREFWSDYWNHCHADEHKSGRAGGGRDHSNWVPSFEYLTREATMLAVYDRVASCVSAEGVQ